MTAQPPSVEGLLAKWREDIDRYELNALEAESVGFVDAAENGFKAARERQKCLDELAPIAATLLDSLAALGAENERLRGFARDVLDSDRRYSIDGADVESLAQKHGLLTEREVTESCGEECMCAES